MPHSYIVYLYRYPVDLTVLDHDSPKKSKVTRDNLAQRDRIGLLQPHYGQSIQYIHLYN